jgi:CBS domain containing-hemolysin-like protein
MCSIALGLVAEPSVAKLLEKTVLSGLGEGARHTVGLIIALSFVTFLHILIGEMVPKNIALADAPRTSMALAPIHATFVRIARPLVWLLNALANLVLRALGVTALDERASAKTPEELAKLLEEARDGRVLDGYDFTLLSNTLELGGASIENAVVPLAKVATAPSSASVAEIERRMAASGHSRLALTGTQRTFCRSMTRSGPNHFLPIANASSFSSIIAWRSKTHSRCCRQTGSTSPSPWLTVRQSASSPSRTYSKS